MAIDLLLRAGTRCHNVTIQVNQSSDLLSQLHSRGDRQTRRPALGRKYSKRLIGRALSTKHIHVAGLVAQGRLNGSQICNQAPTTYS